MNKIVYLLITFSIVIMGGCSFKNIYRYSNFQKPPLTPGYVKMSRTQIAEAGVEPVEGGEVVAGDNTLYVATQTNGIEAYEISNFSKKWTYKIKNGVSGRLLLDEGNLYFSAEDGHFYSINTEFGKLNWKYETKSPGFSRPTVLGDRVYFTSSDDVLYCLDKNTGKWIWHYKRSGSYITTIRGNSTPTALGSDIIVGFSDGYLVALKLKDGNLDWETKVHNGSKFTDVDAMPVVDAGKIYIPSYDGGLFVLDAKNGKILWRVDMGGTRHIILDEKSIYLASTDGYVYSLNKESGKIFWKFELDRGVPTNLVLYDKYIAFGSSQEYFYAIYKADGAIAYRHDVGLRSGFISNPIQFKNSIYTLSAGGNLYQYHWNLAYNNKYYSYQ